MSTVPLKISYFAKCFPDKDWNKQFKKFIRDGLLQKKNDEICLSKKVRENLLSDPHEIKSFHQAWLEALESIKHYIDIPFYFALHYIALEKFDDAIIGMTDILIDMECGWENAIYLSLLETIAESKILTRINSESRVNFYNMMGLCLSRSGNHLEAIKWFLKLRSYSKRIKHFWGIGQSYINCGYAYFEINEIQKAERCYRKAVEHGKTTDDKWLLGRALHNLSMTIFSRDMGQAIKLMNESLKIKKEVEDIEGVATALFGYGNLAIEKGEIKEALRWYQKAERKAKKFNLTYLHSLALINIGRANTDLNNLHTAIDYFQRAKKIGASEGYRYTLFLALKNEAMARLEIEEFKKAEILFRDLYELEKSGGDFQEMLAALHNTGVALIKQKKYREARRILGQGLKLASKNDDREWIFHCHLTSASSHCEAGNVKNALQALSNHAQKEEKRGLHIVAGQLWEKYVALLIENNGKNRKIERTFKRCIQCFEKAEDNYFYLTRVCERLYLWRWDNGLSKEALAVLDKLEEIAKVNKQNRDRIRFIDQKGVCFQELGMFKRAEKAHRSALKLARRLNDLEAIMPSLQNLGELFRKTHRLEESIQTSEEAEKIAAELNDMESQISISHNRALTLRQSGNILKSEKILMQCRDRAKRNNLVYEYVRAIYGLADSAQIEGKNKLAERRYLEALKEAKINGLEEYKTEIIYNYSVLLRREKRFGEAVEILEEQREHFKNFSDATSYYISIANLYEEMGNLDLAKKYWEEAKKEAGHFSDQSTVTQCIDALERIAQHEKESQLTEDDFEKAIQKENDPKKKAVLMAKYVSLLLSMDREKKAEEILDTTMEIAKKNDFKDILLELYQTYGDYLWQKSSRLKYRSLQVYFVGLRETFDYNDSFVEIGKHIIDQLITIEPQKRHKQIQSFYERLSRWLRKPFEMINHSFTIDSVLWPLKVVMELPPIIGEEIPDHQIYLVSGKLLKRITEN